MKIRSAAAASLALGLTLAGCGGGQEPLRLSAGDDGRAVEVGPGAPIEIRLESNPSTGFAWSLVRRPDAAVLRFASSRFEPAEDGETVLGRGGTEIWRFEGVAPGETSLQLAYLRSWEPEQAETRFSLSIRVVP